METILAQAFTRTLEQRTGWECRTSLTGRHIKQVVPPWNVMMALFYFSAAGGLGDRWGERRSKEWEVGRLRNMRDGGWEEVKEEDRVEKKMVGVSEKIER